MTSNNRNHFILHREGEQLQITLVQEVLTSHSEVSEMFRELEGLVNMTNHPDFVLNMKNVSHVASVFLGNLVKFVNSIENRDGKIVLTHVNEQVLEVFRLTRMEDCVTIQND